MSLTISHAVTSGTFTLDGATHNVDNNVWVIGDDSECVVLDAPHDVDAIMECVGGRKVIAIICTHAHDDHIRFAPELRKAADAPLLMHPADKDIWELTHPGVAWDKDLADGDVIEVGGDNLHVIHTPGHSPGGVCVHVPSCKTVFTADTLFKGGPGATGQSFSDRKTIEKSIITRLFPLGDDVTVHTGHGDSTTLGEERRLLTQ